MEALKKDRPRDGRPPKFDAGKAQDIVRLTTQTTPANATHWSMRSMAAHAGVSDSTVLRIWRAHRLKPHRMESFKLSNDPQFAEKLEAIHGIGTKSGWRFRFRLIEKHRKTKCFI